MWRNGCASSDPASTESVPPLSQTEPAAGDHAFRRVDLWQTVHSQRLTRARGWGGGGMDEDEVVGIVQILHRQRSVR